ncbi:hypothetical protein GCM10009727_05640 [Actinomadura napierensis]|uniref:Lasso RiPP family leader peptide-containing protein n=1 Tax=Actinomadura napierensis TaxID=267854 RepID=A0ABN2Y4E6_9ACTN
MRRDNRAMLRKLPRTVHNSVGPNGAYRETSGGSGVWHRMGTGSFRQAQSPTPW